MLAQKRGGCPFDLAWAAMARIAGVREDLGRRFAGLQVGLGTRRHHQNGKRNDKHAGATSAA
jgi:hypothetical protein